MNGDFHIRFDTTVENIQDKIKGNGHILPMKVRFKVWPEEDSWIEPGMMAYIVDMVDYGDNFASKVYLYFGEHEDYNRKFFKRDFHKNEREDLGNKKALTALENGLYDPHTHILLPKEDKFIKYFNLV